MPNQPCAQATVIFSNLLLAAVNTSYGRRTIFSELFVDPLAFQGSRISGFSG